MARQSRIRKKVRQDQVSDQRADPHRDEVPQS